MTIAHFTFKVTTYHILYFIVLFNCYC